MLTHAFPHWQFTQYRIYLRIDDQNSGDPFGDALKFLSIFALENTILPFFAWYLSCWFKISILAKSYAATKRIELKIDADFSAWLALYSEELWRSLNIRYKLYKCIVSVSVYLARCVPEMNHIFCNNSMSKTRFKFFIWMLYYDFVECFILIVWCCGKA